MPTQRISTRERLLKAAQELFVSQGVTETTTRQIAEVAAVNEVTLFRQFGNKHGLLLAVIAETAVLSHLSQSLIQQENHSQGLAQLLQDYARACLQTLEQAPELVRSVIGEAGQYPVENRQVLGRDLHQANRHVAEFLAAAIAQEQLPAHLAVEKIASLLNTLILGNAILDLTSEFHHLWQDREDFLNHLLLLFCSGAISQPESRLESLQPRQTQSMSGLEAAGQVADLSASIVHSILQRAKKLGLRDYGLAYVLFAAGLSPKEIAALQRSQHLCDPQQHLLQITQDRIRQVPVNRWIMGQRYGSYTHNPLTRWLKSRKDKDPALFLNSLGYPISETEIVERWQVWSQELSTAAGKPPAIEQSQQTWCVEMLMRGISLIDLSLLTGWERVQLEPYARRAREKTALAQASRLDQSPSNLAKNET
jgi:AcrR family transcriptional regulator